MPETPWSERASDWAEVMEGWNAWGLPVYRAALEHLDVGPGTALLDVGCGAGRFLRVAADRGADVAGLDATDEFVEIARSRIQGAEIRAGDMEALPWPDSSFDVVTGFNSFFIAGDMTAALREARRVTRPAGRVALTVFGRPERCQSTEVFRCLEQFAPPGARPPARSTPGLHEAGVLEGVATDAGLTVVHAGFVEFAEDYPDLPTMLRGYLAAPPFVRAARAAGREPVQAALAEALGPLETTGGTCRLVDEVRLLVATA